MIAVSTGIGAKRITSKRVTLVLSFFINNITWVVNTGFVKTVRRIIVYGCN
jgi:hypothetical protein